jgi:hypothetical protein
MIPRTVLLVIVFLACISVQAQYFTPELEMPNLLQENRVNLLEEHNPVLGVGIKLTLNIAEKAEFRFSVSGGVQKTIAPFKNGPNFFLPGYQLELMLNNGGIGASLQSRERQKINIELYNNFNFTFGIDRSPVVYGRPIWKMASPSCNALYDPYKTSISIGTTFINGINHKRNQRVGIGNFGYKKFQVAYLNDATPYNWVKFADTYDRWWTGSLVLGMYEPQRWGALTEISLRYDRYTGWQQNAFEAAGALQLDYIAYRKKEEVFYNQGRWQILAGFRNSSFITAGVYSMKDLQDIIHYSISKDPFHQRSLRRSGVFGGGYRMNSLTFLP